MGRLKTRLIDAEVLKERIITPRANGKDLITELIDSMPTVDAIPIEWLIRMRNKHNNDGFAWIYEAVMDDWREEHAEID